VNNVPNSYVLITFYVSRFIVCSTLYRNRNNWWEIGCYCSFKLWIPPIGC